MVPVDFHERVDGVGESLVLFDDAGQVGVLLLNLHHGNKPSATDSLIINNK